MTHLTTDVMFSGHRFAILAMFYWIEDGKLSHLAMYFRVMAGKRMSDVLDSGDNGRKGTRKAKVGVVECVVGVHFISRCPRPSPS